MSEEVDISSNSNNIQSGDPIIKYNIYSNKLKKIKMVLNTKANKVIFKVIWDKFYKKLKKLKIKVIKDNKVKWQRFSKSKTVEINNFFFANIIGLKIIIYF